MADLCILGLIITLVVATLGHSTAELNLDRLLWVGQSILLFVTIVFVYRSRAPWTDTTAKTLIWIVFGVALFFNVVFPFILAGAINIPAIIIYALVFPYLIWLQSLAGRCTASSTGDP